ncbi:hypothetical protein SKAU_G00167820 [Synaphobranchus kaupii]|uniref:Uncharacterized protein n=1 Tax=Synaphobranchus kaupii TaxID=118154 RepID=A0A9Q1J0I6_SYNKA|nr:hypothetical protein SKAU_G00167820 [Synaphobranchus kaupii]
MFSGSQCFQVAHLRGACELGSSLRQLIRREAGLAPGTRPWLRQTLTRVGGDRWELYAQSQEQQRGPAAPPQPRPHPDKPPALAAQSLMQDGSERNPNATYW